MTSFGEMNMIEDMLLAVAVIPCTFGAVAELEIGILCVSFAADRAFVIVAALLLLLADRFSELNGFRTMFGFGVVYAAMKFGGEEDNEVQHGDDGSHSHSPHTLHERKNYVNCIHGSLKPCHPFDFDGDDKIDTDHGLGIIDRKGEEHGGVHIVGAINA